MSCLALSAPSLGVAELAAGCAEETAALVEEESIRAKSAFQGAGGAGLAAFDALVALEAAGCKRVASLASGAETRGEDSLSAGVDAEHVLLLSEEH